MNGNGNGKLAASSIYLRCSVQPGMFNDELYIIFQGLDPDSPDQTIDIQVLVDNKLVKDLGGMPEQGQPVDGLLLVELVRTSEATAIIALPQPAVPIGDTAIVRRTCLVEAT